MKQTLIIGGRYDFSKKHLNSGFPLARASTPPPPPTAPLDGAQHPAPTIGARTGESKSLVVHALSRIKFSGTYATQRNSCIAGIKGHDQGNNWRERSSVEISRSLLFDYAESLNETRERSHEPYICRAACSKRAHTSRAPKPERRNLCI